VAGAEEAVVERAVGQRDITCGPRVIFSGVSEDAEPVPGLGARNSRCIDGAIAESTKRLYDKALRRFATFLGGPVTLDTIDAKLLAYWDYLLSYGEDTSTSQLTCVLHTLAGVLHYHPELRGKLPLAARGRKGFSKIKPSTERDPLPRGTVALLAAQALHEGREEFATILMVSFDALLRVSEWGHLRVGDVVDDGKSVALLLGEIVPTKTGVKQGVELLDPAAVRLIRRWLGRRRAVVGMGGKLFSFSREDFADELLRRARQVQLCPSLALPHCLRHGGATHMISSGFAVDDVLMRGRWKQVASLLRYAKPHTLVKIFARMPEQLRDESRLVGTFTDKAFQRVFEGLPPVWSPSEFEKLCL